MRLSIFVACIAAVAASPQSVSLFPRIVGGRVTTIEKWPSMANVMHVSSGSICGGTVINNRSVLSAAHCARGLDYYFPPSMMRLRLGSSFINRGGQLYNVQQQILHPNYNMINLYSDIMILRTPNQIFYSNVIQQGHLAPPHYNLADNQEVWATGWGHTRTNGTSSDQLREVQVWSINQEVCVQRFRNYGEQPVAIFDSMMCSGWLDVGGRDSCQGDSGGPVFHRNNVVGITSFGSRDCGDPYFPAVNIRVSSFFNWIEANV